MDIFTSFLINKTSNASHTHVGAKLKLLSIKVQMRCQSLFQMLYISVCAVKLSDMKREIQCMLHFSIYYFNKFI